jgi:TonB family protein
MQKNVLLLVTICFLASCNNSKLHTCEQPIIESATTKNLMRSFNVAPSGQSLYIKFEPNDKANPRQQAPEIGDLLGRLKSQPQHFLISGNENNEIQGECGTKISITPGCFVTATGNEVNGEINIELKECYQLDEMLQENLTTATTSGQLLESKGGVFVSATCNGEELRLKQGQEISIQFPFACNNHDGYSFFYGQNGPTGIDWIPVNDATNMANPAGITKPEFNYKESGLKSYLVSQLDYPDEARRNELSTNVEVSFIVDKNGRVRDIACISAYKTFRDEITTALQHMPKWKPAIYGEKKVAARVKLNIDFNLRQKEQVIVNYSDENIIPVMNEESLQLQQETAYSKSFDKMGWINYSRFMHFEALPLADVVISSRANTDIKLIITGQNVIVPAGNYVGYCRFKSLPVGTNVFIVAVRNENGQPYYALQPVTLQKQTVLTPNWQKATNEQITAMLKSLVHKGKQANLAG